MPPSTPPPSGRDPWSDRPAVAPPTVARGSATPATGRATPGRGSEPPAFATPAAAPAPASAPPSGPVGGATDDEADVPARRPGRRTDRRRGGTNRPSAVAPAGTDDSEPVPDEAPVAVVPVRPRLSLAIAGFAALLSVGLILGAQTSGPGARTPYAVVVFGVQLLFILAWTMATRPPALKTVAAVAVAVAAGADLAAVLPADAGLAPLVYVAAGGILLALGGQVVRRTGRLEITDALGSTLLIILGVASFATLIVLTRRPAGTQAVVLCLLAAGVSLLVARLVDTVFPRPRMAAQVPRGATGVVLGAMLGTLVSAVLGRYLVGFQPGSAAVVGLVAAGVAALADLAVNYAEAGRQMAGRAPTLWAARHMQGPLGGFALAAPGAYAVAVFYLT